MKRGGSYAGGPVAFVKVLEDWRAAGDFVGLDCVKESTSESAVAADAHKVEATSAPLVAAA